jgi:outer membrane protein assembly factor BamB
MMDYTHEFHEMGNGFPSVGDYVLCDHEHEGIQILKVESVSRIHTRQFSANWVYLVCKKTKRNFYNISPKKGDQLWENSYHVTQIDMSKDEYAL